MAANSRRWWRNSGMILNAVLTLNWSGRFGLLGSHDFNFSNRPVRDPHAGWCGRGATHKVAPYADCAELVRQLGGEVFYPA